MTRFPTSRFARPHPAGLQDPSRRMWLKCAGAASAGLLVPAAWAQSLLVSVPAEGAAQASRRADEADPWGPIREALLAGLNLVPVVGGFLSYLGALFIPGAGQSAEQRWRAYTDDRISEALFTLVKAELTGLSGVAKLYADAVRSGDMTAIRTQSIDRICEQLAGLQARPRARGIAAAVRNRREPSSCPAARHGAQST